MRLDIRSPRCLLGLYFSREKDPVPPPPLPRSAIQARLANEFRSTSLRPVCILERSPRWNSPFLPSLETSHTVSFVEHSATTWSQKWDCAGHASVGPRDISVLNEADDKPFLFHARTTKVKGRFCHKTNGGMRLKAFFYFCME